MIPFFILSYTSNIQADQNQDGPFAVVELFSSEGCSSCPSADLLVSKLTAWARQNNEPVYPMIFHVDYWNNLGWRDVFSRPEFTQRQNDYSHIFRDQGIYTPQMIVNGSDVFVGSDQGQLQKDLNNELTIPANMNLKISLTKQETQILVHYQAQGYSNGDLINIVLVERGLKTDVTAGENAGRTLHHDNVVREFITKDLKQAGSQVAVPLTKVSDISQASVIVFVQNPQTMMIEDAKQLDVDHE